ncbi:IBR domain [Arabidopsis thaliana x Arabidopsis arenosa]|uniref:RBR-type E3 ubiquitin transferase n=1 Tax=Arabidopsis thaliana x Arabidopsis arenosa TaxID=1240361 RepID=A0A8T2FSA1_9BRAS|nr:IBR domain [Arabidopsis thaliana x Arabidopsis arenosa]
MERDDINLTFQKRRIDSATTENSPNPKGDDSSKVVNSASPATQSYRLYFKGLVSDQTLAEGGKRIVNAGFGVAICDNTDEFLFEIKESLSNAEISRKGVEILALIRGLSECLNNWYVERSLRRKLLVEEVKRLREQMTFSEAVLVARNDVKFAYRLAREEIVSKSSSVNVKEAQGETCVICLEETVADRMFFTDKCLHRYCFSCVKQTCVKCNGLFCIDCKVPSHSDLSCADYKKLHPELLVDDIKLKLLANENMWRQCVMCRHLIELSDGCNHMTCRCGYQFCYGCGIEWKKNQDTCPSGCREMGHGDADSDDDVDDDEDDYCM